jgi:hypothetical protein
VEGRAWEEKGFLAGFSQIELSKRVEMSDENTYFKMFVEVRQDEEDVDRHLSGLNC